MSPEVLEQAPTVPPSASSGGGARRRVLLVLPIGHLGGGPETVRLLAQHLDRGRFEVSIACPDSPMMDRMAKIDGLTRYPMAFPTIPSWQTVTHLARIIREQRIDLVHSQLFHGDLYAFLATRLAPGPRLASTIQGINFFWEMERHPRRALWWAPSMTYRAMYRWFDGIAACSEATKAAVCERPGIRIAPSRIRAIHNTIDVAETRRQGETAAPLPPRAGARRWRIITVANFDPVKGHDLLIDAIQWLGADCSAEWWLVGDGPERSRIEHRIRALGLADRVHLLGYREDAPALIRACDLFVFPSLWDGLGMAVLEAMALGVPVVACAAGGVPEIIEDGVNGLLVPPHEPVALSEAIRRALNDRELAQRLTDAGRGTAERFDARAMAAAYGDWYDSVMAHSRVAQ